ncbi:MAG: ribonuclease III [Firmicutes bacterium]|nr:ribonuclease III [Bacillota bacterium]MBQ6684773.1 ribonuclease III [Bacillota bacterium]
MENNQRLREKLGYEFRDLKLLRNALTHSSSINETHQQYCENNERLEFLGDAVLETVISERLYRLLPTEEEGRLTRLRASIVCEESLAEIGHQLGIGQALVLGKGEEQSGGRKRNSMIADGVEAIIGAIYLDGGFYEVQKIVLQLFESMIQRALEGKLHSDYKTALQERLQVNGDVNIQYVLDHQEGPDHDKVFYTSVMVNGMILGSGSGRSKKEAEQNAAKAAMKDMR